MNRMSILLSLVFAFILPLQAQEKPAAQDALPHLQKQLSAYRTAHPSNNLFLHLDKNIYSPEETIWFKAYLLGDTATDNKVLYVRITDEDKEIVLNAQFPMYDIRAHGDLQLPERLTEGNYSLYAYTDRMLSYGDTNVFVQPIRIRKNIGRKLEAEALVSDSVQLVKGGKVQVMARIRESGGLVKKVKGEYELIAGEKTIKYGRLTTNEFGEAFINFTYPELANNQSLKVNMLFSRDNDYAELSLNLPHEGNPLKINIYPEGGQLIEGVSGKVAIEVLDIHQNPVSIELLVKKAGQPIGKIRSNKQGIAMINLKAETGSNYTVETASGKKKQTTVRFPPVIHPEGYSLKLQNNEEQATVTVYNKNKPENALLVLRSSNEILWSKTITAASGDSVKVSIPAAGFPKNILSLAVLDGENKPQAERLFLNRTQEDYKVTISTQQKDFGLQKKVTVTINIADTRGNPVVANLSVAAIEKSRMDSTQYRTILQSWYYRPFEQANRSRLKSAKSANAMDGLLIANCWLNNSWSKISTYLPKGPPLRLDNTDAAIGMVISPYKKKIEEIDIKSTNVNFSLAELNKKNILQTRRVAIRLDENNRFIVPSSDLLSWKGNEWILDGAGINFNVQWKDHDIQFDQTIVKERILQGPENLNSFANSKIPKESPITFTGVNQLAEVTIGGKEEKIRRTLKDKCTDWICGACGSLNCPKRPESKPIKGKIYHYRMPEFFGYNKTASYKVIYLGCGNYRDVSYIKNITNPEEFYLPDYDSVPHPNEDIRSTIYWNPNLVTDANGTATFSFFTSDIMGEFEIIAQGLEVNTFKPLMGTGGFTVKANE
jgi:hypothetical protein